MVEKFQEILEAIKEYGGLCDMRATQETKRDGRVAKGLRNQIKASAKKLCRFLGVLATEKQLEALADPAEGQMPEATE